MTVRISKDGKLFRYESSPCFQEHLFAIFTPESLHNVLKFASLPERDDASAEGKHTDLVHFQASWLLIPEDELPSADPDLASSDGEVLGAWQSTEAFKVHRFRVPEQSTGKRRLSSTNASQSVKLRRPCTTVRPEPQSSSALQAPVDDDSSDVDYCSEEDDSSDDDDLSNVAPQFRHILIGDEEAVRKSYHDNLEAIQQIPCKHIAKSWVKVVEPKKQAQYPYNGGAKKAEAIEKYGKEHQGYLTAPPWWPPLEMCPHTEPDHIKKHGMCSSNTLSSPLTAFSTSLSVGTYPLRSQH